MKRGWQTTRAEVTSLAATYGLACLGEETNVANAETPRPGAEVATFATCAASAAFSSVDSADAESSVTLEAKGEERAGPWEEII